MGATKNKQVGIFGLLILFILTFALIAPVLAEPKKGGELRLAYGQFPSHFNCAIQSGAAIQVSAANIFVALVENMDRVIGVHIKDPSASEVAFKNQDLHYAGFNATFRLKALPRLEKLAHISISQDGYEAIG